MAFEQAFTQGLVNVCQVLCYVLGCAEEKMDLTISLCVRSSQPGNYFYRLLNKLIKMQSKYWRTKC